MGGWEAQDVSTARVAAARWTVLLACTVLGLAPGCAAPEYTYVKNTANRTYFKVPSSWRVIDEKALTQLSGTSAAPENDSGWAVAYDAAQDPSPAHLVGNDTPEPIVYASVQPVPQEAREQVSLDSLRNLLMPVTPEARAASSSSGTAFSGFSLVSDAELTAQPGFRGVHEIFQYRVQGGPLQTFDQTVYVNKDASKVYALLLRCSNECYQARRAEVETVTASFTVKEGS
jgi:hypothetical protein